MNRINEWLSRAGFAALAVVIVSAGAGAAMAADADPYGADAPASITIRASAADLGTSQGTKALATRIRAAATTVCGGDTDPAARSGDGFVRCREAAISGAVRRLDAPLLARALGLGSQQLASGAR